MVISGFPPLRHYTDAWQVPLALLCETRLEALHDVLIDGVDHEQHLNISCAQALQERRLGQDLHMYVSPILHPEGTPAMLGALRLDRAFVALQHHFNV